MKILSCSRKCFSKMFRLILVALALSSMSLAPGQTQSQTAPRKVSASARISWGAQDGVSRFRLQVARDQSFSDTVIDRAVKGNSYLISGLSEGKYYWRVSPIGTGKGYSAARLVRLTKPKPKTPVETASTKRVTKPAAGERKPREVATKPRSDKSVRPKPETTARDNRIPRPTPRPTPTRYIDLAEVPPLQPTPAP